MSLSSCSPRTRSSHKLRRCQAEEGSLIKLCYKLPIKLVSPDSNLDASIVSTHGEDHAIPQDYSLHLSCLHVPAVTCVKASVSSSLPSAEIQICSLSAWPCKCANRMQPSHVIAVSRASSPILVWDSQNISSQYATIGKTLGTFTCSCSEKLSPAATPVEPLLQPQWSPCCSPD